MFTEVVYSICSKCGEPLLGFWMLVNGEAICHRRHSDDPPNWEPKPLTLAERLAFYKESKRS